MLRLGALTVDPPLVLAPMAGVTDRDFRGIVRRIGGAGLVTMEFVPSRGVVEDDPYARRLLHFDEAERPLSIQIYGSDAATMAEAAAAVEELGVDACDVNMGCPANRVLKGCAGARLMDDLPLARQIVRQVRRRLSIPLTVKFRLGMDERRKSFLELGRICQGEGADGVAMHARTARQMYSGEARWEEIARLKEALSIPVLGNGDVATPRDAVRMLRTTGCDGVLVGRAATKNPWIFRQTAALLARPAEADAEEIPDLGMPTLAERRELVLGHFRTVVAREEPRLALHKLRTFTRWYSHGIPRGVELRRRISQLPDADTFLAAVEEHFDRVAAEAGDGARPDAARARREPGSDEAARADGSSLRADRSTDTAEAA